MSKITCFYVIAGCCLTFLPAEEIFAKGYMGGEGTVSTLEETSTEVVEDGGAPDSVEGPLNDKMADSGKLFGDLFKLLRHHGETEDSKLVPQKNEDGTALITDINPNGYFNEGIQLFEVTANAVGGEPVLTVIDVDENPPASYLQNPANKFPDYGWYAVEAGFDSDGEPFYDVGQAPYPAMCVQPVADYKRWGDISGRSGLAKNRLPMIITYDPTWKRSECEVGELVSVPTVDVATGVITLEVEYYFIEPEGTWEHPMEDGTTMTVTYPEGVLWAELVDEVHFGRLNIGRSPEAVLQAAFDEAISSINSPDTTDIRIDASGRLLLTKNVYDEYLVDPATGSPLWLGTAEKAIDSPLENIALYVKLMQDGHLVTPADERLPIDRSNSSGTPLWKVLELSDGPAQAALRPTIDMEKMRSYGLGSLVDVVDTDYITYYQCVDSAGIATPCLCLDEDPVQPELETALVACDNVVDRKLYYSTSGVCPDGLNDLNPITCDGPFTGIVTDGGYAPDAVDLNFSASFLAAAADKTGDIDVDMIVYLNSILGINKVIGYSEYDDNGDPAAGAVDYSVTPKYFDFCQLSSDDSYGRENTFNARGEVDNPGGNGVAATYDGNIIVLQKVEASNTWVETKMQIMNAQENDQTIFHNIGRDLATNIPNQNQAETNIQGFAQQADDDLSVIEFIHTYQLPGLR